jgi:hypothetical protein
MVHRMNLVGGAVLRFFLAVVERCLHESPIAP